MPTVEPTRGARRTHRLEIALHQDEHDLIRAAALRSGHTPGAWVRHIALTGAPPAVVPGSGPVIDRQIAASLADLARHAHDATHHVKLLERLIHHLDRLVADGQRRDPRAIAEAVGHIIESRGTLVQIRAAIQEVRALLLARIA